MQKSLTLAEACFRCERAQAAQNAAFARAMACADPSSGAAVLELPGAVGVFLGEGHFLNQGLALGLGNPLPDWDLEALEAHLGRGGHPVVVELSPGAEEGLAGRLGRRGYVVRQFQQVWWRVLGETGPAGETAPAGVRVASREEIALYNRLVAAGFADTDELAAPDDPPFLPPLEVEGTSFWMVFVDGEPAAGGGLGLSGGVAVLSGTAVLPRFRGQSLQRRLIRARLAHAAARGARLAVSATVPLSASAANLVAEGFAVAYPKVEMAQER